MLKRAVSIILVLLHITTFAPLREVLAFSAEGLTYRISSGVVNVGGRERNAIQVRVWQDTIGEVCAGRVQSASYVLTAGYIPTIQTNPPILKQDCPYQILAIDTAKEKVIDLDDYFISSEGYSLKYTIVGNSKISVSIDPGTHEVSFSSPPGWSGVEKVYFIATDTEGNTIQSNEVVLQAASAAGSLTNKPIIVDTELTPQSLKEGDLAKLVVKARDLDGQDLSFAYSDFFTEDRHWKDGDYWYSQSSWQVPAQARGHYNVRVTAADTTALTDSTNVLVNIGNFNHAPVLDAIADITAKEGDLIIFNLKASDPDGDPLTYYYTAPFDSQGKWQTGYEDGGNSGTPSKTYDILVSASDGTETVSQTAKVIVNNTNRAPQVTLTLSKYTVLPNEQISIILNAADPDNDPMSYVLKKDGMIIEVRTFSVSFADIGDHTITAIVTDSGGLSTTQTKEVDVPDPNANRDSINPVMGDFNGDSLTDLGLHNSDTGSWEICLSDAGVFRNAVDWQLKGFGTSRDWWPIGGDFNGDAKTDIGVYNNTTGELRIGLSNSLTFTDSGVWFKFSEASYSWQPFTGNFNGDKYTDFAVYNRDTGEVKVALGTGSGFGQLTTWVRDFGSDYIAMSGDFNGDSLSDLCLFKKTTGEFKAAFSNTKEFVDGSIWLSGFAGDKDALISDFNNDGLTDIGYWDKTSNKWYYAISTGEKFSVGDGFPVPLSAWDSGVVESATTGDFNGDGITDTACFDRDQIGIDRWQVRISQSQPADLLTEIDNGIGGKTKISYTYAASNNKQELPFPVSVASSISLINTYPSDRAASYTQNFTFSNGYFDAQEREFRGFAKVTVTDPITNNYTETYFYQGKDGQDGALKGQIEKVISYDRNNNKISETINTYEVKKAGPEGKCLGFPALIETTSTVWEENAAYLTTKDKFSYDNIGNVIEQSQGGDAAKTGDEKTAVTVYSQAYESGYNRPIEVQLKDKDGNTVTKKAFEYDQRGNLNKNTVFIFSQASCLQLQSSSFYTYDSFGNLTTTTNALDATVVTDYETEFYIYPERITNALGQSIIQEYDPRFGVITKTTDANGLVTEFCYDSLGRLTKQEVVVDELARSVIYSYPDFHTKITTNAIGLSTTEYIDGIGRRYKTVSPGEDGDRARPVVSEVFYNQRGLTEKESLAHYIDEDENQISYVKYEYDTRARVKKTMTDFPGISIDAESSIEYINPVYTKTTDPLGNRKGMLKDVYGNIVEVTEFAANEGEFKTRYEYDVQNNLIKTIDNQGNETQIFYDSLGRKIKMVDLDMGTWAYEYDLLGNLTQQTDAKGQILKFEYDQLNRLVKKTVGTGLSACSVIYSYDDPSKLNCIGRLSKIEDPSGTTEFFYDPLGREIKSKKEVRGGKLEDRYEIQREYDILDRLTKLTYPDGAVVQYDYDKNSGLLEKVTDRACPVPTEYIQDITYTASGQIKTIKYGNGVTTNYSYGQDLRLSCISTIHNPSSAIHQDLHYLFDKNGNLTTLTDNIRNNIRTYNYDSLDRLTEAQNVPSANGGYTRYSYRYDSIGNMTYKSDVGVMTYGGIPSPPVGEGQGEGVRLPHALTSAAGYTYKYDANGNMTQGKNKTFSYDPENRLIQVTEPDATTTFVYDGDGGRVRKGTVPVSQGTVPVQWTTYIGSLYEEENEAGSSKIEVRKKHIFAGSNRICSIQLQCSSLEPRTYYYHSDHLGSSNIVTDAQGKLIQHCEYTPYGSIATNEQGQSPTAGTVPVKHLFTGKELDSTGLYFYGARYYDPEIGRFITADPTIQRPYDPQDLNRYAYCRNNPINYVDPSGLGWLRDIFKHLSNFLETTINRIEDAIGVNISVDINVQKTVHFGQGSNQQNTYTPSNNVSPSISFPSNNTVANSNAMVPEASLSNLMLADPFMLPDDQSFMLGFEDAPAPKVLPFFGLPALEITSGGIQGGAGQYLKSIANFERIRLDIVTRNIPFLDGQKATRAVLLERVFSRIKPYKWAGKAATALNVVAVGIEIGSTWTQSNLTFGKKAAKTGIILGATGGAYLAGLGAGFVTKSPALLIGTAVGVGMALEERKQYLYKKWGLE